MSGDILVKHSVWVVMLFITACSGLADTPQIVMTLPPPPIKLSLGEQVFAERCSTCHGADGRGGGAVALAANLSMPDFRDVTTRKSQTFDEWLMTIREGRIDKMMPPWQDALNEAQLTAVAQYTYNMAESTANTGTMSLAPTVHEVLGRVLGRVVNGTAGSSVPEAVEVTLHIFDITGKLISTQEVVTAQDDAFVFDDVILSKRNAYVLSTVYQEVAFVSPMLLTKDGATTLESDLQIYDVTTDPSVLSINLLVHQAFPLGDERVELLTVTNFRNNSDRAYRTEKRLQDGRFVSVHLNLPQGIHPLGLDEARFVWDEAEGRLYDTSPVLPNTPHGIYVGYQFATANALTYRIDYPVTQNVELMLPPHVFAVEGENWHSQGMQTFSEGVFEDYLAQPLKAGDTLTVQLRLLSTAPSEQSVILSSDLLLLGMTAIGVLLLSVAAGLWVYEKRRAG